MNISLLKMQIVELIGRHKKITAVADRLGLKQPTVTFHMKSLERELGVQLFEARSGKMYLTEAGEALCHYAVKINALASEAERVVQEFQSLKKGQLKIGASYVPGTYILPGIISSFSASFPNLSISLSVKTAPVIKDMLINHEIDLGVFSSEPFHMEALVAETLCEDEMVVIFSPSHPFARQKELTANMLAEVPFLFHSPESSTRAITLQWAQANGVELMPRMELDSLEAIKQMAMLGEGVSFLSRLAVEREAARGELVYRAIPQNHLKRYFSYAYNENRRQSIVLETFLERLRAGLS
ncbi:LysR family transcriptional regulator [Brevibacillus ruminantium]|uniref:LysR family transcriptional regulator n=1 Tax=Brevibacillus ruminantium TaxID=2950604 RepID=A0ABY4WIU8_9BACL|nr:LysR family transcriptional regulator [Brevibacillus ruminantium]USG67027.1 LysR family transcriptional regulator [Brevibacillus ruminantium]